MTRGRVADWAKTSTRLVVGLILAAAIVIGVTAGIFVPWPTVAGTRTPVSAQPPAATTTQVCTGPLVAAQDPTQAQNLSVAAAQSILSATANARGTQGEMSSSTLNTPSIPAGGAQVLSAPPSDGIAQNLAGVGVTSVQSANLSGLAVSSCAPARSQSWLVAGATTTGSTSLIVLANPGQVPASVTLTTYGATGGTVAPGGSGIIVPPGSEKVVPLAGLLPREQSPVIKVVSSGAPVAASLQSSIVRGLVPGGVEQTTAVAQADTTVVIPGLSVISDAASSPQPTTVARLLSPGAATTATIVISNAAGEVSRQQIPLTADIPAEVQLQGLADGIYTVTVTASTPVLAAAWQTTGLGDNSDFAWFSAATAVTGDTLVAAPAVAGAANTLTVEAGPGGAATVTLTPLQGGGAPVTVTAAAARTASVALPGGVVYRLSTSNPVFASVSVSGAGALSSFPVLPGAAQQSSLVVYP